MRHSLLRVVFGVLYSGRLWWFLAQASLSDDAKRIHCGLWLSAAIGCVLRWTRDYKTSGTFWAEIRYKTLSLAYASKHKCKVRDFVPFFFCLFLRARKAMMVKPKYGSDNAVIISVFLSLGRRRKRLLFFPSRIFLLSFSLSLSLSLSLWRRCEWKKSTFDTGDDAK